ncbi:hypothetical protein F7D57_05910 [Prevotella copri]|uniref:Uncharacterized protein n=1 Tax=Segatella copri TaxID=165179 RepID=A0AA90VDQ3_9BACT|nr:hypothetical protein [Segatella copri]MQO09268.1 hypothetical protein [Segatella copri]
MYIHGSFLSQQGDTITVHIVTGNDRTQTIEIGTEKADVYFSEDPAEIENEVNDTFDVLLRNSAKIRLLCGNLITNLFSTSCRDAVVNIYKNDTCIFAGFIEPQTLSQPYNDRWDELELNCIDALSALQYSKYKNVGALGVIYAFVKAEAAQRSFYDIATEILQGVTEGLDILGNQNIKFWYDGSKAVDAQTANRYQVFKQLSISDLLFLGDDESDVWQQDEVLEELLKYLNLHIVQDGFNFYIFSWESVKAAPDKIIWHDIVANNTKTTAQQAVTIALANVADCDTTISIGDVYNQLLLTAKVEDIESVIESPLDDDLLVSPYVNKQKYLTEYSSDGEGKTAYYAMKAMVNGESTNYGGGAITHWYVQVMRNKLWTFPMKGNTGVDLVDYFGGEGTNQHALPDWLGQAPGAAIMALGSVKINTANDDNSPTSKVNMTNYLVVSVNGNGVDNDENKTYPSVADIQKNIPYAVYTGNKAGGVFSPSDDKTTNYIVLSGKVILNPIMAVTGNLSAMREKMGNRPPYQGSGGGGGTTPPPMYFWHKTVPSRNNGDGRYYTRQYWQAETPDKEVSWHEGADSGFYPYTGEGPEEYEFKYSAVGDSTDTISKVAVLACMLVIGDKCVVETGTDGQTTDFVWQKYKERSECQSDDEYYQQCFTIGFDPKIGDKLVGTEFSIQNNIDYKMGIDAEGIAIPITKGDKISGQVRFMILGPVNATWDVITRRHPTFFRHTKWSSSSVPLLAHVSSILIKSFEVKVYSDNGLISNGNDDNDIIYMSDTKETFVNKKDDLEFKINSALTATECAQLGVSNTVKLSTPLNISTGDGVLEVYDRNGNVKAKPEQIYVDSYYTEYHKPRIVMAQKLRDIDNAVSLFNHYRHEALNKEFFVQGIGRNLIEGRADLTLKEIGT